MQTLGILGVGHLATYTTAGLRHGNDQRRIILSPRNTQIAAQLAAQYDCEVAADNQAVVDQCDLLLLAVRPAQIGTLLADLTIPAGKIVISALAGVTLRELQQYPALQGTTLIRALPSASAEGGVGPVPLYPDHPIVNTLFSVVGKVAVLTDEKLFDIATAHACLHGWTYLWLQEMVDWSVQQGMDVETARLMISQSVGAAVQFGIRPDTGDFGSLGRAIASEGTFTLKGWQNLERSGAIKGWTETLEQTLRSTGGNG